MLTKSNKSSNPFYLLLVLAGLVFAITACAYGVMIVRVEDSLTAESAMAAHPLMDWLRANGNLLLLVEVAVLAAFTWAAIGTDEYWQRRAKRDENES